MHFIPRISSPVFVRCDVIAVLEVNAKATLIRSCTVSDNSYESILSGFKTRVRLLLWLNNYHILWSLPCFAGQCDERKHNLKLRNSNKQKEGMIMRQCIQTNLKFSAFAISPRNLQWFHAHNIYFLLLQSK